MKENEIKSILEMLERKEITADEAKRLIEALQSSSGASKESAGSAKRDRDRDKDRKYDTKDSFRIIGQEFQNIGKTISKTVSDTFEDIKKEIVTSLSDEPIEEFDENLYRKDYVYDLKAQKVLIVDAGHAKVSIGRNKDDKLLIGRAVREEDFHKIDDVIDFSLEDEKIILRVSDESVDELSLSIKLPDRNFEKILVQSAGKNLIIRDTKSDDFTIERVAGFIKIQRCQGKNLKVDSIMSNIFTEQNDFEEEMLLKSVRGAVTSSMDKSRQVNVQSSDGPIKVGGSSSRSFKAENINGTIAFDFLKPYQQEGKFLISAQNGNGSININMNSDFGCAFECTVRKQGGIRLARDFNAFSVNRNSIGRISYAKGESKQTYKASIVAGLEAVTNNGSISLHSN